MQKDQDIIYAINHYNFIDKIVLRKRLEISNIINNAINDLQIHDALDIGTTSDDKNASSNIVIKNIKNIDKFKCISDQIVNSDFFHKSLNKSITEEFSENELYDFSSDLVVSNATIEHVGNTLNQKKMLKNIIKLTKKIFVLTTPNKFYPIELHTKIPLIHWFPKSIYRKILKFLGLSFYADEKNLNLLSVNELKKMLDNYKIMYEVKFIKLFFFKSNIIIIGKKFI
ncbi:DUF758 domain-containing protein [Candidatus Pelagibacter communis]|jgi:hypothetical protein|uniref:TNF alpha-induced protein 8 family protein n=1 Tax=Pelagibacter ubique TaxID=198252 RepID=UPI000402EE8E|nr:DUF758 domain-containing protein [Candidatus Pelagibacter ubique]